ncbi:MAG TPA: VacJ family lipoprotein [Gammaproteobacteria bacterium]|nr:VacJ family lipoprotein [Gammaproteobacteria bacterium]
MSQTEKKTGIILATVFIMLGLAGRVSAADNAPIPVRDSTTPVAESDKPLPDTQIDTQMDTQKDPYEPFNRIMYHFNDFLDHAVLKPVATFYNKIMPKPLNKGIKNFFSNVDTVPTVANDVLQGNIYQGANDGWRLVINSTVGILGFFDVASNMGLEPNKEDFGLTLAQWGYTKSNYLVLPFFGPSTPRDAFGLPVDYYLFSIYPHITPRAARYEIYGLGVVARRADLLSYENVMEQASIDKYAFLRDAYLQRRAYLIQRNKELGDPYVSDKKNKPEPDVL